ncbi:MAG: C2HC-type zinc finger protein, partial [archaeon]|nr:C2HC-type zinc finger protein [archaeon]
RWSLSTIQDLRQRCTENLTRLQSSERVYPAASGSSLQSSGAAETHFESFLSHSHGPIPPPSFKLPPLPQPSAEAVGSGPGSQKRYAEDSIDQHYSNYYPHGGSSSSSSSHGGGGSGGGGGGGESQEGSSYKRQRHGGSDSSEYSLIVHPKSEAEVDQAIALADTFPSYCQVQKIGEHSRKLFLHFSDSGEVQSALRELKSRFPSLSVAFTYATKERIDRIRGAGTSREGCFSCGEFGHIRKNCPRSRPSY